MATGPRDTGPKQPDKGPGEGPRRPDTILRSAHLLNGAGMVTVNSLGNQMFRDHSERLQQAAAAKDKDQAQSQTTSKADGVNAGQGPSQAAPGKDAPVPAGRDAGADKARDKEAGARQLSFAKDYERGARQALKVEAAKQLSFVKDQGQDINRGR